MTQLFLTAADSAVLMLDTNHPLIRLAERYAVHYRIDLIAAGAERARMALQAAPIAVQTPTQPHAPVLLEQRDLRHALDVLCGATDDPTRIAAQHIEWIGLIGGLRGLPPPTALPIDPEAPPARQAAEQFLHALRQAPNERRGGTGPADKATLAALQHALPGSFTLRAQSSALRMWVKRGGSLEEAPVAQAIADTIAEADALGAAAMVSRSMLNTYGSVKNIPETIAVRGWVLGAVVALLHPTAPQPELVNHFRHVMGNSSLREILYYPYLPRPTSCWPFERMWQAANKKS